MWTMGWVTYVLTFNVIKVYQVMCLQYLPAIISLWPFLSNNMMGLMMS